MKKILVVDDEWKIRKLIKDYLTREEYSVDEAEDGEKGLELFYQKKYDLVILDIMLPKVDGWSVCRKIRDESTIPVIMLSARTDESDQLFGFELKADDYIVKPFNPKLLVAKVKALLRRDGKVDNDINVDVGDIKLCSSKREVRLKDKVLELTPKEYDLLYFFIENDGIALSREKILNSVWGWEYYGDLRTVDTHIKRLRRKIGDEYVQTVRGFGYKFEGRNGAAIGAAEAAQ
ncbi:MAG: response regulator transcription factor [Fusobacteriaceae bacterium]|jgi:DNA-binding response OmpR family regulator|nr:response regulator transcription factor [Fusobacteriaceae bacterium]